MNFGLKSSPNIENLPRARLQCLHLLETLVKAGVYAVVNAGVYAGVRPVFMLE